MATTIDPALEAKKKAMQNAVAGAPQQQKSAYQLQREQVQGQAAQQKEAMQRALKERLSAQGMGTGSGVNEKQQRLLDVESAKNEAQSLAPINVAEASAQEQERQQEQQRQFQSGESALDRQLTRDLEAGRISQQDKQMALQASQFDSEMAFKTWATEQGYKENDINRAWQANQNANQMEFQEKMSDKTFGQNQAIQSMQNDFATNRMRLADQIDDKNKLQQGMMDSAYKQGLAGIELPQDELDKMSDLEYNAYQQGLAGRTYEDYQSERDAQIQYKNALITKLDPDDPNFQDQLNGIYQDLGLDTGNVNQPVIVYSKLNGVSKDSPEFKAALAKTPEYAVTSHVDGRGFFTPDVGIIDNPPKLGSHIQMNGEIFEVTSDVQEETSGENYQYFWVTNVRTGIREKVSATND